MIDLTTTNVLLGIMALVSVLEAVALIVAGVMGLRIYREVTSQIQTLEQRHVMPLAAHATTILQTVQRISDRVEHSTSRVDAAVEGTMQRAEMAVDRMQGGVRKTTGTLVGVVRGVRTAIETFRESSPTRGEDPHGPQTGSSSSSNGYGDTSTR